MRPSAIACLLVCLSVQLVGCQSQPPVRSPGTPQTENNLESIVFVCRYGSAKSVVAARFFNRMAGERLGYQAVARGIEPEATIPPYVREPIRKDGFEIGVSEKPVPLDLEEIRNASAVVCIRCQLPQAYAAVARKSFEWGDVPDVDAGYDAARDKIIAHLNDLLSQLAPRSK